MSSNQKFSSSVTSFQRAETAVGQGDALHPVPVDVVVELVFGEHGVRDGGPVIGTQTYSLLVGRANMVRSPEVFVKVVVARRMRLCQ